MQGTLLLKIHRPHPKGRISRIDHACPRQGSTGAANPAPPHHSATLRPAEATAEPLLVAHNAASVLALQRVSAALR